MTKYILAGGNDRQFEDYGVRLAEEVYKTVQRPVRILSCFFAVDQQEWQAKAADWERWFKRYLGDDITYVLASAQMFAQQVAAVDVVYLHGGDSNMAMVEMLAQYPQLGQIYEGKVVIGSSAGANALSRHYWTRRRQEVLNGVGIVPHGLLVHYGSDDAEGPKTDWKWAVELVKRADGAPPLLLREGQFVVIET